MLNKKTTNYFKFVFFTLGFISTAFAQEVTKSDPNSRLAFKKLYVEKIEDNAGGTFNNIIEESFGDVLSKNPRFERVDNPSKADTFLKTRIDKLSTGIELEVQILVGEQKQLFSNDKALVNGDAIDLEIKVAAKKMLKTVLTKVPFSGTVTGRDGTELTFDIGALHGVKRGDILQISRIDQIQEHPLLKSIVDLRLIPVGTALVEDVEDVISFGRVHNELPSSQIERFYKITSVAGHMDLDGAEETKGKTGLKSSIQSEDERPRLGYIFLGPYFGSFSSSSSSQSAIGTASFSGSAMIPGFRLGGEAWLTKNWFIDLSYGMHLIGFKQEGQTAAGVAAASEDATTNSTTLAFHGGYKFLFKNSLLGPQVIVKAGYRNFSWNTPIQPAALMSPKSYSGFHLDFSGELPMEDPIHVIGLGAGIMLFTSLTEEGSFTGSPDQSSVTAVNFHLGYKYRLSTRIQVDVKLMFESFSTDFGDPASSTTSQKQIGVLPTVQYLF